MLRWLFPMILSLFTDLAEVTTGAPPVESANGAHIEGDG